jgi:hypothetical protein
MSSAAGSINPACRNFLRDGLLMRTPLPAMYPEFRFSQIVRN